MESLLEYVYQLLQSILSIGLFLIKGLISKQRIKQLISYIKLYFKLVIQINKILFFMKIIGKKRENILNNLNQYFSLEYK